MSCWVYILKSKSTGRYYCGSSDDVNRRIQQHNDPTYHGSKTTKRIAGPWQLIWKKELSSRSEAMTLEKQIKKRGLSGVFILYSILNQKKS